MSPPNTAIKILLLSLSVATALATAAPYVQADEVLDSEEAIQAGRNWTIAIPVWIPGYRGEFAVGGITVDGESSGGSGIFDRLFDTNISLNFFFMGGASYERGRWRAHGDIFGGKFTEDVVFKATDGTVISASVQPIIAKLVVQYRALRWDWGKSPHQLLRLWVYGGVRDYDVRAEASVFSFAQKIDTNWADPIVGVWVPVDLSRRWMLEGVFDVGGFDVGSRFSWQLGVAATYRATPLISLTAGYNVLDVDYRDELAGQPVLFKVRLGGPGVAVRFNF